MAKRSVAIAGHRTSISLEEPFWQALGEIATARGCSLSAVVAEIDRNRTEATNLSSAIRVFVLAWFRNITAATPPGPRPPPVLRSSGR